jgi:DNA-binding transcriptional ArsR family regulator
MPPTHPDDLDAAFAALADPTRRAIVAHLAEGEATVGELAAPFPLTHQAISHHVGILRRCGLIEQRTDGRRRPCRLKVDHLSALTDWIETQRQTWAERLDALDAHLVETGHR